MKLMIIGGGAIGLLTAAYLKQVIEEVTLCTRTKKQANEINEHGLTLINNNKKRNIAINSIDLNNAPLEEADVLIFTVKSYDLHHVLKQIEPQRRKHQSYLFLQNGMSHVEEANRLADIHIGFGTISHGAIRESLTNVRHTGIGELNWSYFQEESVALNKVMHTISQSDFPVKKEDDWQSLLWSKLLVNVCINPLTALTGVQNGELILSIELKQMMRAVFEEAFQLHPLQIGKEQHWQNVLNICEQTKENQSSMLVDIKAGRQTEVDSILGFLVRLSENLQVSIPIIHFLNKALINSEQNK
ncbi:2-dehydropantoate 2-reductase [Alkalicoccobacillus plakortidis]|uniref:2-dehydropantoate 2-reductase n=1 Tax=Alkalicoccobacillus plakortidis TaxID=444060 RepID=A0ABT0XI08_9BACI|nr:2-dehydropantoate 2-reductase [Alkalicoccobacillus plakortidis]MCM2674834.1 2-dehydropantoate 2-reductase [Alkalicoccobacillus plakortidis]